MRPQEYGVALLGTKESGSREFLRVLGEPFALKAFIREVGEENPAKDANGAAECNSHSASPNQSTSI
jgi:hypothetical protein